MEAAIKKEGFEDLNSLLMKKHYSIGNYTIDVQMQQLLSEGETKNLTTREFELLVMLVAHQGEIVEREFLLSEVWSGVNKNSARSMDVYICKLRKLLANDPKIFIVNFHKKGYKLLVTK